MGVGRESDGGAPAGEGRRGGERRMEESCCLWLVVEGFVCCVGEVCFPAKFYGPQRLVLGLYPLARFFFFFFLSFCGAFSPPAIPVGEKHLFSLSGRARQKRRQNRS